MPTLLFSFKRYSIRPRDSKVNKAMKSKRNTNTYAKIVEILGAAAPIPMTTIWHPSSQHYRQRWICPSCSSRWAPRYILDATSPRRWKSIREGITGPSDIHQESSQPYLRAKCTCRTSWTRISRRTSEDCNAWHPWFWGASYRRWWSAWAIWHLAYRMAACSISWLEWQMRIKIKWTIFTEILIRRNTDTYSCSDIYR